MRAWQVAIALAGALVTASCGSSGSEQGTAVPPAGSTEQTSDDAGVDEPCPSDVPVDMSDTQSSVVFDEQSRLEPMLGVVLQYANDHADQFGGYGLHWLATGDASVFVSFTGDLAEHRAALAERVEFPDELIVCQAPASKADQQAIEATLVDELRGRFTSIGSGTKSGAVTVDLNATEEALAAELVERYGAAVEVSVGALAYPLDAAESVCRPTLEPGLVDGLEVSVVDDANGFEATPLGTLALTVRLANTGDTMVILEAGHVPSVIADSQGAPRTRETRASSDVGMEITVEPGTHHDFDLNVSLASCDPADGYVLPAGDHFLVVSFYNEQLEDTMHSEPLPITIIG